MKGNREGGLWKMLLITCHLTHTAAVSMEGTVACLKKKIRGQITQESYKNAFNSSQSSVWKKYLCTKGGDLKVLVFTVNLCQPVFWEKNAVSFGKQREAEQWRGVACDKDNIAQWDIPCHSHCSSGYIASQKDTCQISHMRLSLPEFTNERKENTTLLPEWRQYK